MGSINPIKSDRAVASTALKSRQDVNRANKTRKEVAAGSDSVILNASFGIGSKPGSAFGEELYRALSITSREVVDRINEPLKIELPVQSLNPEEWTPDATAERIVSEVTAFFDIYASRNRKLAGDELVDSFVREVTRGVERGYREAFEILKAVGAFQIEGVQSGIEETRSLIDAKLAAFSEKRKRQIAGE